MLFQDLYGFFKNSVVLTVPVHHDQRPSVPGLLVVELNAVNAYIHDKIPPAVVLSCCLFSGSLSSVGLLIF